MALKRWTERGMKELEAQQSRRNIQESAAGKKVNVVRTFDEKG